MLYKALFFKFFISFSPAIKNIGEVKLERLQSRSEFICEDGGEGGIEFFFASDAR